MIPMQGSLVGSYRVTKQIGHGGMGDVYEAINESIGRRVAIKFLNSQYARQHEVVARFLNEARAANQFDHPGIVQIYESACLPDGTPFIVMELLKGVTLATRLRQSQPQLPLQTALQIAWQIADALAVAHDSGIIHRDLKPSNLMLVPDALGPGGERIKILDFGIAKLVGNVHYGKTASHVVLGTPTYMSPEQCRGAGEVDKQTDVYSLGAILYEMLAGQPPFVADGSAELMGMHLFMAPPLLDSLVAGLPAPVLTLVQGMLHKDRAQRLTMAEARVRLRALTQSKELGLSARRTSESDRFATRAFSSDDVPVVSGIPTVTQTKGQLHPALAWSRTHRAAAVAMGVVGLTGSVFWLTHERLLDTPLAAAPRSVSEPVGSVGNTTDPGATSSTAKPATTGAGSLSMTSPEEVAPPASPDPLPVLPSKITKPRPEPVPGSKDIEGLSLAHMYLTGKHWEEALQVASTPDAREQNPALAWKIIGVSACMLGNAARAREAEAQLAGESASRQEVIKACQEVGLFAPAVALPTAAVPSPGTTPSRPTTLSARDLYELDRFSEAVTAGQREARSGSQSEWLTVGRAACKLHNAEAASEAYQNADEAAQSLIEGQCRAVGYKLINRAFRSLP